MQGLLVIVPCGKAKVWDRHPERQAVPAQDAYTGAPFTVNMAYARRFAQEWRVLSAKYGFLAPDEPITRYNVTFKDTHAPDRITVTALRRQIGEQGLDRFPLVVGLGGSDYRAVITEAFALTPARVVFPFAGLPIGRAMAAVNQAIADGSSHEIWLRNDSRPPDTPTGNQRDYPPLKGEEGSVESRPWNPGIMPAYGGQHDAGAVSPAYQPLAAYLAAQPGDHVICSFEQIEAILGRALPRSARLHAAWWANSRHGHSHATAWLAVGWSTSRPNLTRGSVTFVRRSSA